MSSDFLSSMNFGQVTDRQTDIQTQYDAYEPTVHTHRWAQKMIRLVTLLPHVILVYWLFLMGSYVKVTVY